jgi:Transposase IS200 like
MLTDPRPPQSGREGLRRTRSEPMRGRHGVERRSTGCPLRLAAPRQLPCDLPGWIGFHRATTGDELTQHRVIHPHTSEKPRRDQPALRGVRAQRPGPHMRRRTLRALARTRFTHRIILGRCRRDEVGLTHSTTVGVSTDNPDVSPRPAQHGAAARPFGVRGEIPLPCIHLPRTRMRGHLWSPSYFAVSCRGAPLSIIKQYVDGQTGLL